MADQVKSFDPTTGAAKILSAARSLHLLSPDGGIVQTTATGRQDDWVPGADAAAWRKCWLLELGAVTTPLWLTGLAADPTQPDFVHSKIIVNRSSRNVYFMQGDSNSLDQNQIKSRGHLILAPLQACIITYHEDYSPNGGWFIASVDKQISEYATSITGGTSYNRFPSTDFLLQGWMTETIGLTIEVVSSSADVTFRGFRYADNTGSTVAYGARFHWIHNDEQSLGDLVFEHESASGSANEKIRCVRGVDERLKPGESGLLLYNSEGLTLNQAAWAFVKLPAEFPKWETAVTGAGPHDLVLGRINRYNDSAGDSMVLRLPDSGQDGDEYEVKEVGGSTNSVSITTPTGTTNIEKVDGTGTATSDTLNVAYAGVRYKWDATASTWRIMRKLFI